MHPSEAVHADQRDARGSVDDHRSSRGKRLPAYVGRSHSNLCTRTRTAVRVPAPKFMCDASEAPPRLSRGASLR
jgi:hypothetical protein